MTNKRRMLQVCLASPSLPVGSGFSITRHAIAPHLVQIVMTNEGSEYLSYFPEWAGLHRHISGKYAEFRLRVEQTHQQLVTALSVSGKSYQSAVENHVYRQYLLALHEGA